MTAPVHVLGPFSIASYTREGVVQVILEMASDRSRADVVITPNMSMFRIAEASAPFRRAVAAASLTLADGWPVAVAASVRARRRVSRAPGSDLLLWLLPAAAGAGLTVAFCGGQDPAAAARAAARLAPGLRVVLTDGAQYRRVSDAHALHDRIAVASPDVLVLAFGTPKQELMAAAMARPGTWGVALCLGAATDFLSGHQRRAPVGWRALGCEWLWRVLQQPARLGDRYVFAVPSFLRAAFGTLHDDEGVAPCPEPVGESSAPEVIPEQPRTPQSCPPGGARTCSGGSADHRRAGDRRAPVMTAGDEPP